MFKIKDKNPKERLIDLIEKGSYEIIILDEISRYVNREYYNYNIKRMKEDILDLFDESFSIKCDFEIYNVKKQRLLYRKQYINNRRFIKNRNTL